MLARRRSAAIIVAVAIGSILVDQITKTIAEHALSDGPIDLVAGARLVLTYNAGGAFSVGSGRTGIFLVLPVIVVTALFAYALWARHNLWRAIAFGLIIGGAAGNVVDRLFRDNGGRVIDFIEGARWYPVWNVADMSLFFGIVIMLWLTFRESRSS